MNKENVIKGLETIKQFFGYGLPSTAELFDSYYSILNDALSLLKEQEAVKPVLDEQTGRIWLCGKCGSYVGFEDNDPHDPNEFDRFCRDCGTPVLWEDR